MISGTIRRMVLILSLLVWQHEQLDRANVGDFNLGRDIGALFRAPSSEIFILKVDYRLGL